MVQSNPFYLAARNLAKKINIFGSKGVAIGQQRPVSTSWQFGATGDSLIGRGYDLEIPLNGGLIRDSERLRSLIEMRTYCPEIKTAVAIQRDDCFSSEHGDDQGVFVSDWVDRDKKIPVDPIVKRLCDEFIYEHFGAETGKPTVAEALTTGDSFSEIVFDERMTKIERIMRLPVGEMFRLETRKGYLEGFEQRAYLNQDLSVDSINGESFHPLRIIHWRYQQVHLYGESLFEASKSDYEDLKQGAIDLAKACRDLGVIPVHHKMAPGSSQADKEAYERSHRQAKKQYLVTDFYTMPGVEIARISSVQASLTPLVDRVLMDRERIAMACRTPSYSLGIRNDAAKQLSGQPASAYARHIASVRQMYSAGVNQVLDIHLALNGIPPKGWRYRLVYPEIVVNPFNLPAPTNRSEKNN